MVVGKGVVAVAFVRPQVREWGGGRGSHEWSLERKSTVVLSEVHKFGSTLHTPMTMNSSRHCTAAQQWLYPLQVQADSRFYERGE